MPVPKSSIESPKPNPQSTSSTLQLIILRDCLCALYPSRADQRRIVIDADMDGTLVSWSRKPRNTWHSIIDESLKQQKLCALLATAKTDYPQHYILDILHRDFCPKIA